MNFMIEVVIGAVSGALAGLAAGCLISWNQVSAAFTGWRTFWPDCGPQLFIPLWLGTVIGLISRMERESFSGIFITILSGMAAGFAAPTLFWLVFGRNLQLHFGFIAIRIGPQIIISAAGGAAGFFWHMGVNRIFR